WNVESSIDNQSFALGVGAGTTVD
ncbi:unnamed protein product, partial [Rotaria socialis]